MKGGQTCLRNFSVVGEAKESSSEVLREGRVWQKQCPRT
jgi:hypothetical protein